MFIWSTLYLDEPLIWWTKLKVLIFFIFSTKKLLVLLVFSIIFFISILLLNMSAIFKIQQWPQDWKRSVFIPIPKKGEAKECSNYCTIVISHASKVYSKSFKLGFINIRTENCQIYKLDFKKAEELEIKLPTFVGS